jgi:multiple sugar transport system permease protein
MKKSRKIRIKKIVYQILALLLTFFLLLPIYQAVITALRPENIPWTSPMPLIPFKITLDNFPSAFTEVSRLPIYLFNSFIYGLGVSLLSIGIAIPAGYSMARFRFVMRKPLMVFVIYANMFAPIMLLVPIYVVMRAFGLINTYFSVILAGSIFTIPLSTWLMVSYMQTIPKEIEEAAMVDGCSEYSALYRIIIPIISPALVATFMYAFITGWSQQFILSLVLINSNHLMPITQGLYMFFSKSSVDWNRLMAAILVSLSIPVILFLIFQKYIVKGLTSGSIK